MYLDTTISPLRGSWLGCVWMILFYTHVLQSEMNDQLVISHMVNEGDATPPRECGRLHNPGSTLPTEGG